MELNMKSFTDPFLRKTSEIKCPPGLTPFDAVKLQPWPSIMRTFENLRDSELRGHPKTTDLILTVGCAVGLDEAGNVQHFYAGHGLRFIGFLQGQTADRASVKTRGSIILKIAGLKPEDRGAAVYCTAPNEFSLKKTRGAAEIGAIRYVQDGRAAVAFRRFDDARPLNLKL